MERGYVGFCQPTNASLFFITIIIIMKTAKQIQERITYLESREKDKIDVKETLLTLKWALIVRESDIMDELFNSVNNSYAASNKIPFLYIRDLLWILE